MGRRTERGGRLADRGTANKHAHLPCRPIATMRGDSNQLGTRVAWPGTGAHPEPMKTTQCAHTKTCTRLKISANWQLF
eukprot:11219647-Lingulodinium_polyedra.AAC.1